MIQNNYEYSITTNDPNENVLTSTVENPAELYNTWSLQFVSEIIVPLCKIEAFYLEFTTETERATFLNFIESILGETLGCCHDCDDCGSCPDTLEVDQYNSIIGMPAFCNYEYVLNAECECINHECFTTANKISLCNFVNCTGEKLRKIVDRKKAESKAINNIITANEKVFENDDPKEIGPTGLSSVAISYNEDGLFKVAIVCLETATQISFSDLP